MNYIKFNVNKLVRDKIQQKLAAEGVIVHQRVMEQEEFVYELKRKLIEEAHECVQSKNTQELTEEIGDVLEIINALAQAYHINLQSIEEARSRKAQKNGLFEQKIYCTTIDVEESSPKLAYYLEKPNEYPRIKQ